MFGFLFASENLPFTVALAIMIALGLMEGIGMILGAGLSTLFDNLLPDFDADMDVDLDADADLDMDVDTDAGAGAGAGVTGEAGFGEPSMLLKVLGFIGVGKIPIMALAVLYLTTFGLIGLILQRVLFITVGMVPGWIAAFPVALVSIPIVRRMAFVIARILPKEETSAVSSDTFVGRIATITLGTARTGNPAQGKVRDHFGLTHYVMIEPDDTGETFTTGTEVLLVRRAGGVFRAIRNLNPALVDHPV